MRPADCRTWARARAFGRDGVSRARASDTEKIRPVPVPTPLPPVAVQVAEVPTKPAVLKAPTEVAGPVSGKPTDIAPPPPVSSRADAGAHRGSGHPDRFHPGDDGAGEPDSGRAGGPAGRDQLH